ncbi:hypothetical protein C5167_011892 [Papaver somniferum]|uniref:Uncharacterized protein n=1 Tax=Papaver somniferum TaxID=3469 RepID=A0A4Y7J048_PAPSO|nr:hypothetical protein C5167_011892 [Papaver somniferum]
MEEQMVLNQGEESLTRREALRLAPHTTQIFYTCNFVLLYLETQYFHDHATFTVVVGLNQQCEQVNAPDPIINTCSDFYKFWQATHDLHEAINLCYAASIATNPMEDNLGDNLEARGLKKHLKRINALKHCMLGKLGGAFISPAGILRCAQGCVLLDRDGSDFSDLAIQPFQQI